MLIERYGIKEMMQKKQREKANLLLYNNQIKSTIQLFEQDSTSQHISCNKCFKKQRKKHKKFYWTLF